MLAIDNLTIRIAGREILSGASANLPGGRRIGLVGRNGAGKSTLLKAITGELAADGGAVSWPRGWKIGGVAQEAPGGPESLVETVLAADTERARLMQAAESESSPHELGEVYDRLLAIDAYSGPARAASILAGLGFSDAEQQRPCAEFSGGWRMRVALAAVLFQAPDLLLLDEPTNYLDLEGLLWLEEFLLSYRGTILIVSHDRDLLNKAAEFILHLERGKLTLYSGGYDTFTETRAARRALDVAFAKKQEAARAHMQAFVDRFRAKASKARQAQSRLKMLARMQIVSVPLDEHVTPIRIPEPVPASPPLITMDAASVGYAPGKPVLSHLSLRFDPDDRIALLGKNGNGKSTLAKLLAAKLEPMAGTVTRARKLVPGYFAQHQLEELDGGLNPIETLAELRPKLPMEKLRTQLGGFGFSAEKAKTKVANLSGGERARLMLALATLDRPNLLILDEPTNHLDIDAREELLNALNDFEGAVVLVSHDRRLLDATANRLLLVSGGRVEPFDGDLDDYRRLLLAGEGAASRTSARRESAKPKAENGGGRIRQLKSRADKAEREVADLSARIKAIDEALAAPGFFQREPAKAADLAKQRAAAAHDLEQAESAWLAANDEYERASA
ncbi:MAG TPA: ABC-F family ATP-binding cassette domain-containing protein [Stellaceae bacterium]|nr:ABC-F family ATP-binding cassette domain-containing protein [Stellaceae bacterium]